MGKHSDIRAHFEGYKEEKRARRRKFGIPCPLCQNNRPRASPTLMMPGQKCKIDGYKDNRDPAIMEAKNDEVLDSVEQGTD